MAETTQAGYRLWFRPATTTPWRPVLTCDTYAAAVNQIRGPGDWYAGPTGKDPNADLRPR